MLRTVIKHEESDKDKKEVLIENEAVSSSIPKYFIIVMGTV